MQVTFCSCQTETLVNVLRFVLCSENSRLWYPLSTLMYEHPMFRQICIFFLPHPRLSGFLEVSRFPVARLLSHPQESQRQDLAVSETISQNTSLVIQVVLLRYSVTAT